jgi:hypothetical protein
MKKILVLAALVTMNCSMVFAGEAMKGLENSAGKQAVIQAAAVPAPTASASDTQKASPMKGPYIEATVGKNVCQVTPAAVTKITEAGKEVTPITPALNAKELETLIKAAGKEPLTLHGMDSVYPTKIVAGIFPGTASIDLYTDDSRGIYWREGDASTKLLNIIGKHCE